MIPLRGRECELRLLDALGREEALQIVPLVDVGAADMLDLPHAHDGLARLMAGLGLEDDRYCSAQVQQDGWEEQKQGKL